MAEANPIDLQESILLEAARDLLHLSAALNPGAPRTLRALHVSSALASLKTGDPFTYQDFLGAVDQVAAQEGIK